MASAKTEKSRGLLNSKTDQAKFRLALYQPSPHLAFFIDQYWIVTWDLRGEEPSISENLPYPSVHLVFEKDNTKTFGVITAKFVRRLEGQGRVFGIKFRPGAFYPFIKSSVSRFTDTTINFSDVFCTNASALEDAILSLEDETEMVALAEKFLTEHLPERDENITLINQIIDRIIADRTVTKVDHITDCLNKRSLQRLFNQYVGVSPKWVIKRYRLHEAAERLMSGEADSSRIALELGYFDQAHFIKDFKSIIGKTPAEYAKHVGH